MFVISHDHYTHYLDCDVTTLGFLMITVCLNGSVRCREGTVTVHGLQDKGGVSLLQ